MPDAILFSGRALGSTLGGSTEDTFLKSIPRFKPCFVYRLDFSSGRTLNCPKASSRNFVNQEGSFSLRETSSTACSSKLATSWVNSPRLRKQSKENRRASRALVLTVF